jgi:hypothetical protein
LKENNILNQINIKGKRNKELSKEEKERNRIKSKTRVRVEHIFALTGWVMKSKVIRTLKKVRF